MHRRILAAAAAVALIFTTAGPQAHADTTRLDPFTADELANDWEGDRRYPTGGVSSVAAFDRDDVAQISVDSSQTASGGFQRTEGIKTVGEQDFGSAVTVDLYLDPAWESTAARAGVWVVGDDGTGARDELFGIIDFVNSDTCDTCTSHADNTPDYQGWRIWDSTAGWTYLPAVSYTLGDWVNLTIALDTATQTYHYAIDGVDVGTGSGGEHFIREVFLNSYNFGNDSFVDLDTDSYTAHWHAGLDEVETKDQCEDGGWEEAGFRNQGQCVRFVNTGGDSR